jgi:GH15 family glucan-1,4-alpha-glucosidase
VSSARASLIALALALCGPVAAAPQRTWGYLTTGNGHGFQVYDLSQKKITTFLEHPYRYLKPNADPKAEGVIRRNLAFDFYFGVRGGGSSGWLNGGTAGDPEYVDDTNIIHVPVTAGAVSADTYYFAPFGYEGNAMIALIKTQSATDVFTLFNFHMGSGQGDTPGADGESLHAVAASQAVVETGPGGGAMVYVALSGLNHADCNNVYNNVTGGGNLADNATCSGTDVVPGFQRTLQAADNGWVAVAVQFVENAADADATAAALKAWGAGRTPDKILADAQAEWTAWRKPPPANIVCTDDELHLWKQSEAVLRMGQVREANTASRKNHGMILASLPPGQWHSGWVRDATYAVAALARSGHAAEAKAALDFFMNAGPVSKYQSYVSNQPYRISVVRYFGSGEEEADYSGQPTPNIEIDGWGLVLWAARQYVDAAGDTAWLSATTQAGPTNFDTMVSGIATPLSGNLESNGICKADSSIWEVHDQNKKHFAYTTMSAARGFCDLAAMAKKAGNASAQSTYAAQSMTTKTSFLATFVDSQGALGGSLEELSLGTYLDAAVLEAFDWNLLPSFTGPTAKQTLDKMSQLRVSSGGFKRNDDGLSSYDSNEWIMVDFRAADALRRGGKTADADALVQAIVSKASANFYLLPELYNAVAADGQIGKYTGSIPMVGYGGGAYILTILDRAGLSEPNDCGDGASTPLPQLTCAGAAGTDGGITVATDDGGLLGDTDGGSSGPGGDVPRTRACVCDLGPAGPIATGGPFLVALAFVLLWLRLRRPSASK